MITHRVQKKFEQGFTLIEVVIVIAIFTILIVALLNLFEWHNKLFYLGQADIQATGSARATMNSMSLYIPQASSVLASHAISGTTYTTDGDTLVLQLPSYDSSGNLINNTNDYVVYYLNSGALYQLISLGSGSGDRKAGTKQLSEDVANFALTYDQGDVTQATKVIVNLTTQATVRGGQEETTIQVNETFFLRNK